MLVTQTCFNPPARVPPRNPCDLRQIIQFTPEIRPTTCRSAIVRVFLNNLHNLDRLLCSHLKIDPNKQISHSHSQCQLHLVHVHSVTCTLFTFTVSAVSCSHSQCHLSLFTFTVSPAPCSHSQCHLCLFTFTVSPMSCSH